MSRRPTKEQCLELIKNRGIEFSTILDVGILTGTPEMIKAFPDSITSSSSRFWSLRKRLRRHIKGSRMSSSTARSQTQMVR